LKPNKGHIGVIDAMIQEVGGPKKSGWFARTFCTLESYNRRVIRKFSGLTEEQKEKIEALRRRLVGQTIKAKKMMAKAQRKAKHRK
jgi:hypothetical protein